MRYISLVPVPDTVFYTTVASPVGPLLLAGDGNGLRRVSFEGSRHFVPPATGWIEDDNPFSQVMEQLDAYFAGRLKEFNLPLALAGTPFQLSVWRGLTTIPYGETISYGQLATRIGNPKAVRAVGSANGSNPLPIIIPCHRVIGSNGGLTGFGGGLPMKKQLLALESRQGNFL